MFSHLGLVYISFFVLLSLVDTSHMYDMCYFYNIGHMVYHVTIEFSPLSIWWWCWWPPPFFFFTKCRISVIGEFWVCIIILLMSVAFDGNFLGGKKTLQRPTFFFPMMNWWCWLGALMFFLLFFLAKSQGWQNSVIVRVLICGDAPVSVKRERERERENFRRF